MPVNKARKDLNRVYGSTGTQDVDTEVQDRQLLVDDAGRAITKQADAAGVVINPRKEDGHGATAALPSHVNKAQSGGAVLPAAAAAGDAEANATLVERIGARLFGWNGASWDRLRSTTANGLDTNPTDRDVRLLGRVKNLNVAGAVINPSTEETLVTRATEATAAGIRTDLGTDGAAPPAIPGTGVRGWLRAIYDKLLGTLQVDVTDEDTRILGRSKLLNAAGAVVNPRIEDGHGATAGTPTFADLVDKDARLLGRTKLLDAAGAVVNPRKEDGHGATVGAPSFVDVVDEDARLLGRAKVLDVAGAVVNPRKEDGHGATAGAPTFVDHIDRDARLLGRVKVLDEDGVVIDPRQVVDLDGDTAISPRRENGHGSTPAAPTFADIVDEDTRILGRTKLLDSAGAVIDPATRQAVEAITTALAQLAKLEDAAHASGDAGIMSLGIRKDVAVALAAEGDYHAFLLDALGRVHSRNVPDRPSMGAGRTSVIAFLDSQTADALLHTVTAGKKLYVTNIIFGMVNTSTGSNGRVLLRDGTTAAGTGKLPFLSPPAGAGVLSSAVGNVTTPMALAEPAEFTTGIFVDILAGTVTYSVCIIGYEE